MKQTVWKIGGEAGFGILTTGILFSKIISRLGYFIFDYIQYPSLIRGGHNTYDVGFSDEPVTSLKQEIDILVCLNNETYQLHKDRLSSKAVVIHDEEGLEFKEGITSIHIPFSRILEELKGQSVMKNTIALGSSLAVLGGELGILENLLDEQFEKKSKEVVDFNKAFARAGYEYVKEHYSIHISNVLVKREHNKQLVITGNEAFALGCAVADCRMYVAYPMTPASSVLTVLAQWQNKIKTMIVRHAEDEIAVINTALGSSIAGVRSAVGTSGGGFALMTESLSYAGIGEIPLVVFVSQRPGPATGMPTWTEQGDLLFAVHAGHGEFPKIILAGGDTSEMFELAVKAFDLADKYQTPVIVLSDMLLSESHRSMPKEMVEQYIRGYQPKRGNTINHTDQVPYVRYRNTEDGISPRLIPGQQNVYYQTNSYEHLEDGHTTEESSERIKQVHKRDKKIKTYLQNDFIPPQVIGDLNNSELIFVSWGSSKGVCQSTIQILDEQGVKAGLIHFTHLFPLDESKIIPLFNTHKRYVIVEHNMRSQFASLLRQETGVFIKERVLRYDGRPITTEDILQTVMSHKV